MGTLSALIMFVGVHRKDFVHPLYELLRLLGLVAFAIIIGLFPYVDNFAHIGGLITGFLLSGMFVPYYPPYKGDIPKNPEEHRDKLREHKEKFRSKKIALVAICLPTFIIIYVVIFVLFYVVQPNCSGCQYITCIPFTDTICQDQRPSPDNRDMNL